MAWNDLLPWGRRAQAGQTPSRADDLDHPFGSLQRDINRVFDSFFDEVGFPRGLGQLEAAWNPRINVSETDKEVKVEAEVPGLSEKDLDIQVQDDRLIIQGERKYENESKGDKENYHVVESAYGQFYRAVPLPDGVEIDKIEAKSKDGVVTIHVPKTEESRSRTKKIEVKSG